MPLISVKCTLLLVKRNTAFLIISLILIIVGTIFLAYGAHRYESKSEEKKEEKEKLGIVIDAGGSGTRLIVYSYDEENKTMKQLRYFTCEDEGLGTYDQAQQEMLQNSLNDCFKKASNGLPMGKVVPLYVGATAGMRLVKLRNETANERIWSIVNTALQTGNFKVMKTGIISGFEEAKWAWTAANLLKDTLTPSAEKFGIIDFGSSSIQLAFTPSETASGEPAIGKVDIDGTNLTIYGHSYLCYGKREMERRFLAKLVTDSNFNNAVMNPCYFSGYSQNYTSEFLWQAPCSSGDYARDNLGSEYPGPADKTPKIYTIEGSGNATSCSTLMKDLIPLKCTKSSCGMNNMFQPSVEGKFLALTVFQYATAFMGLPSTASKSMFSNALVSTCATPWSEISSRDIPGTPIKYRGSRCFDAAYSYFLLTEGFKFNDTNWNLEYVNKINGEKLQWSIGMMYSNRESMYEDVKAYILQTITRRPGMIGLIAVGIILLIIGVTLFVFTCMVKRKTGELPVLTDE